MHFCLTLGNRFTEDIYDQGAVILVLAERDLFILDHFGNLYQSNFSNYIIAIKKIRPFTQVHYHF